MLLQSCIGIMKSADKLILTKKNSMWCNSCRSWFIAVRSQHKGSKRTCFSRYAWSVMCASSAPTRRTTRRSTCTTSSSTAPTPAPLSSAPSAPTGPPCSTCSHNTWRYIVILSLFSFKMFGSLGKARENTRNQGKLFVMVCIKKNYYKHFNSVKEVFKLKGVEKFWYQPYLVGFATSWFLRFNQQKQKKSFLKVLNFLNKKKILNCDNSEINPNVGNVSN